MNKILPYIVIAILLGTVTMVAPLMLLGPSDTTAPEEGTLIQTEQPETPAPEPSEFEPLEAVPSEPEPSEPAAVDEIPENQSRYFMDGEDVLSDEAQAPVPSTPSETEPESVPEPEPAVPSESATEPLEPEPEPQQPALTETNLLTESLSNLSSIGMIIIPSFLIALGVFVYFKKRMS